jgi:hypothetical protein
MLTSVLSFRWMLASPFGEMTHSKQSFQDALLTVDPIFCFWGPGTPREGHGDTEESGEGQGTLVFPWSPRSPWLPLAPKSKKRDLLERKGNKTQHKCLLMAVGLLLELPTPECSKQAFFVQLESTSRLLCCSRERLMPDDIYPKVH